MTLPPPARHSPPAEHRRAAAEAEAVGRAPGGGWRRNSRRRQPARAATQCGHQPCNIRRAFGAWRKHERHVEGDRPIGGRLVLPLPDRGHRRLDKRVAWRCDDLWRDRRTSSATAASESRRPPTPALRTSATRPCRSITIRTDTVTHIARVVAGVLRRHREGPARNRVLGRDRLRLPLEGTGRARSPPQAAGPPAPPLRRPPPASTGTLTPHTSSPRRRSPPSRRWRALPASRT